MGERKMALTSYDYSAQGLELVVDKLDLLHDLASEGRVSQVTPLSHDEIKGMLQEIAYIAQETIREMDLSDQSLLASTHAIYRPSTRLND